MASDKLKELLDQQNSTLKKIDQLTRPPEALAIRNSYLDEIASFGSQARKMFQTDSEVYRDLTNSNSFHSSSITSSIFEKMNNHSQRLTQPLYDAFENSATSQLFRSVNAIDDRRAQFGEQLGLQASQYYLPNGSQMSQLADGLNGTGICDALARYNETPSAIQSAMEKMRTPWVHHEDTLQSIAGFTTLQCIGAALRDTHAYDDSITALLRPELGDWSNEIVWPEKIYTDPISRSSFYLEQGLNPSLTSFSDVAFEESVRIAGLSDAVDNSGTQESADSADPALARTTRAHASLLELEIELRQFIEAKMRAAYGDSWIKTQVPGDIRESWNKKGEKAKAHDGAPYPLIAYADFTDYEKIIVRKDNWEKVFKHHFNRKLSVQESFLRLYPIRLCTMHARLITRDDEIFLYVEATRILSVMGLKSKGTKTYAKRDHHTEQ